MVSAPRGDAGSPGRCAQHDLALWPDGTCLLCRRTSSPAAAGEVVSSDRGGRSLVVGIVSVASLVLLLVAVRAVLVANAASRAAATATHERVDSTPISTGQTVDESRRAVRVLVYTTSWCGSCREAKQYMRSEGISFSDRDIEASEAARDEYDRLGQNVIPVFDVDGQVFAGFDPRRLEGAIASAAERRRAR